MFDASAYELAELDTLAPETNRNTAVPAAANDDDAPVLADPALLALAACATCHSALGACAVQAARAGAMPPALALTVCTSVQRMIQRAAESPVSSWSGYLAFVLLGNGRTTARRTADSLDHLPERMR